MQTKKDGFLKLYHSVWNEISHLNLIDKLLYIYLLSKQNRFGGSSFFLSDKTAIVDLGISQRTLVRAKKRISMLPFVSYKPGKYRKSVSEWHVLEVERVPNCPVKGAKSANNPCQNGTTSNTDRSKTDKKKGLQPIVIHNTIINKTAGKEEKVDLETMRQDTQALLSRLSTPIGGES